MQKEGKNGKKAQTTNKPQNRRTTHKKYFEFKEWWDSLLEQFKSQDL